MLLSDLKKKEVVNICDGKKLGYICDVVVDISACRLDAIVVPGSFNFFSCFFKQKDVIIPWSKIRKFGDDVILVDAGERLQR